jgi:hypothetical protein
MNPGLEATSMAATGAGHLDSNRSATGKHGSPVTTECIGHSPAYELRRKSYPARVGIGRTLIPC